MTSRVCGKFPAGGRGMRGVGGGTGWPEGGAWAASGTAAGRATTDNITSARAAIVDGMSQPPCSKTNAEREQHIARRPRLNADCAERALEVVAAGHVPFAKRGGISAGREGDCRGR